MIEQNLKALDRLGGSRTMIKYVGGLPNIKSNVTVNLQPERDGVIIINSITGKTLFRIEKADIISIENDLEKSMYFNIKKNDEVIKVCFKSDSQKALQYFTDIKYNLEEFWKKAEENPNALVEIIESKNKIDKENQNKVGIGCLVVVLIGFGFYFLVDKSGSSSNPCTISSDFIKADLNYPDEASFSVFDCNSTENSDGSFTVLQKVKAKNAFGMEKSYIYKLKLRYDGGDKLDQSNWTLESKRSEAVR